MSENRNREDVTDTSLRDGEYAAKILEQLPDGVFLVNEAFVITSVNEAVTSMTGYARDELVGSHSTMLAGEETIAVADRIIAQFREEESNVGVLESAIRTADDSTLPIETRFSTIEFDDGTRQHVGVLRDATERRHHERTLEALNQSARRLLRADDPGEVCETVADVVVSVWPDAEVVVYLYDGDETVLEPTAWIANEPDPDLKGIGTAEWEAFTTGDQPIDLSGHRNAEIADDLPSFQRAEQESTTVDGEINPTGRVLEPTDRTSVPRQQLFATLDEYGLLVVRLPDQSVAKELTEPAELLAANAVAALGRVDREAELAEQRNSLAERTERLERLHEFNDLLRRINSALVDADTLEGIAEAVCEQLVDAGSVSFAWIGERYRTHAGLRPVARAGTDEGYLDELDALTTDLDTLSTSETDEPTARAIVSGEPVAVDDVSTGFREHRWRQQALSCGFQSTMSVPLVYNDLSYGVLSVYASRADAFAGDFGKLLTELGTTVANAINGVETKRSLRSRSVVELDLRIEDGDALLAKLTGAVDEPVRVEGVFPRSDGRSTLYLDTDGDPSALESVVAVESIRRLTDGADATVDATVTRTPVNERLADYGANVEELVADGDTIETTVTLPSSADVRKLIETLEDGYRSVELRAKRERSAVERGTDPITAVEEQLTDRQLEAVRTAYLNGYFNWPRTNTGEEVAERLGITQPTFNRHLRTTERKLFSSLFGDSPSNDDRDRSR